MSFSQVWKGYDQLESGMRSIFRRSQKLRNLIGKSKYSDAPQKGVHSDGVTAKTPNAETP